MKHTFPKVGLQSFNSLHNMTLQQITKLGPEHNFHSFHTLIRKPCALLIGLMMTLVMPFQTGCGSTAGRAPSDPPNQASDANLKAEGETLFRPLGKRGQQGSSSPGTPLNPDGASGGANGSSIDYWSIVVATVPPSPSQVDQEALAKELLDKIQTVGKLPNAMLQQRSRALVITSGTTYASMTDEANKEVERIQGIIVSGTFPYSRAYLAPPETLTATRQGSAAAGAYDLRSVAAGRPTKERLYSLEVAVYGHADRHAPTADESARFRASAEEAVRALRAEGHEAYVYHGPNSSSVTVGVFSEADYRNAREGVEIAKARQLFPHVLLNGAGMRDSSGGGKLVPCQVVNVPR